MIFPLLLFSFITFFCLTEQQNAPVHELCRFTHWFDQDSLMGNSPLMNASYFEQNVFYWEGQFHQDGIGYHQPTGVTIDHVLVGYATGVVSGPPHMVSNPKNEAYHIMLLTHALAGNAQAATFVYPADPTSAAALAFGILTKKLSTYFQFNVTFPGFAGFLPEFEIGNTTIWPKSGFDHKVAALDNGLLVWAIYSLIQVLDASPDVVYKELSVKWATYFVYLRNNAKAVFFHGSELGSICAVSTLSPQVSPNAPTQNYSCENDTEILNDPYEGELMAWFLYFCGAMNATEGQAIWLLRRPQLQAVNYTGSIVNSPLTQGGTVNFTGKPITGRHLVPVTTQRGLYFGAQEQLKLLFLPYLDVPIVERVMRNAERIRTCNSDLMEQTSGLFAAVSNSTPPTMQDANIPYISNAGIPSAALNMTQEQDVITPYAAFPIILFDRVIGLIWYNNVLSAPCMQTVYGSADGIRRDGSAVSRVVSWETKAPMLLALLGGITNFIRDGLTRDNVLTQFLDITSHEYGLVFNETMNGGSTLMGEDVAMCLPMTEVSTMSLHDYSSCRYEAGLAAE